LKGKIEKNNNFSKRSKKRNQNNKDQIERYNTINLDWKIKLKTTKLLLNGQGKKIEIKKLGTKLENIIFVNWDRMMKLKTNKISTKGWRTEIRN
jgi:hypothetical protein